MENMNNVMLKWKRELFAILFIMKSIAEGKRRYFTAQTVMRIRIRNMEDLLDPDPQFSWPPGSGSASESRSRSTFSKFYTVISKNKKKQNNGSTWRLKRIQDPEYNTVHRSKKIWGYFRNFHTSILLFIPTSSSLAVNISAAG